jgi:hypothetical protein
MPGVQKPHCRPCSFQNASWIGWSLPFSASPSIVTMFAPSACTAKRLHDLTAAPSSETVHAPQIEVSQPMCVPVRPSSSLRKWTSSMRGSTSAEWLFALTVTLILRFIGNQVGSLSRMLFGLPYQNFEVQVNWFCVSSTRANHSRYDTVRFPTTSRKTCTFPRGQRTVSFSIFDAWPNPKYNAISCCE